MGSGQRTVGGILGCHLQVEVLESGSAFSLLLLPVADRSGGPLAWLHKGQKGYDFQDL